MEEHVIPQPAPQAQEPPNPRVGGALQRDQLPEVHRPPQAGVGDLQPQEVENVRPRCDTRPPVSYADFDLSTLNAMIWEAWTKLQDLPSRND